MNMRDGQFIGYVAALVLGAGLLFGTMRFLGYGVGVSESTELDWSSCEIEAVLTPRGGPMHDIRCDEAFLIYEVMPSYGFGTGPKGTTIENQRFLDKVRASMRKTFEFTSWKRTNEDLQGLTQGEVINGYVTDRFALTDITGENNEGDHGKGLMAGIINEGDGYIVLCVSRTKTQELCEGAIADLFEAKGTAFSGQLDLPTGVSAAGDEAPVVAAGGGGDEVVLDKVTPEERAALRKRGEEFYMSQCASCHNPGMTRAPSAPKVGDPYWRGALSKDINDVVQSAKAKCKDERDGGPFSHTISDAEISAAAHHVIVKSAM